MLGRLPADQKAASRLAAAMIRLAAARRTGDLTAAAAAVSQAQALTGRLPDELARHPDIEARVLAARGAVELWSGRLTRRPASSITVRPPSATRAGSANEPAALGISRWRRPCAAGCAAPRNWPARRLRPYHRRAAAGCRAPGPRGAGRARLGAPGPQRAA